MRWAARIGDLSANSDQPFGSYALLLGIALIIAGFGFKITAVPFQMWAPDVYEGSPTPVTAFLSVASKAAGFAIILRVFYVAVPGRRAEHSSGVPYSLRLPRFR